MPRTLALPLSVSSWVHRSRSHTRDRAVAGTSCSGTATFSQSNVGTGLTVTDSGIALSGTGSGNYIGEQLGQRHGQHHPQGPGHHRELADDYLRFPLGGIPT
ncbi:MAG: hypothetical protein HIU84_13575 [Acidobacteria bacterium]|nr:hypothetical protein [Acidobacteriota bacterium]